MTDYLPITQHIKDKYDARMRQYHIQNPDRHNVPQDLKHSEQQVTWIVDGVVPALSVVRYFIVYYCPDCLEGRVGGHTYDKPDGPSARELGIIRKGTWSIVCPSKVEG